MVIFSRRILVVDDEPAIRALVSRLVERAGFPVDGARDGAEAITMLERCEYGVMLVDLMMPNVNGYAVIDYVRSLRQRPIVIVISAADIIAYRDLDPDVVHTVVRKPFDIDMLVELVSAAATIDAGEWRRIQDRRHRERTAIPDAAADPTRRDRAEA